MQINIRQYQKKVSKTYPPTRMPMQPSMKRRATGFMCPLSENLAKTPKKTNKHPMNVPMTTARRPPKRSETYPTIIPPGIIPTEYKAAIRLAVTGSKVLPRKYGNLKIKLKVSVMKKEQDHNGVKN